MENNISKKSIGILFPLMEGGGVFHYALSIAESLINFSDFECFILYFGKENPGPHLKVGAKASVRFISLENSPSSFFTKIKIVFNVFFGKPVFTINKANKNLIKNLNLDLLIIPCPLLFGFENKTPYVVTVLDVNYRHFAGLPEFRLNTRLKADLVSWFSAKHSVLTVVDSKKGMSDLNKFYKTPEGKIRIIEYIPPGYVYEYKNMGAKEAEDILKRYNLPEKFLYYPAQFWKHKNHERLAISLNLIKKKYNIEIPLVLSGNAKPSESYNDFMRLVKEAKIESQIFPLGRVQDIEVVALYKKSAALVFPTLVGPTSIPPLEAIVLERPVVCSGNHQEMKSQVGKAGVFFDPYSIEDMAEKIYEVFTNENLRHELENGAKEMAKKITRENYAKLWLNVINEVLNKTDGKRKS